MRRSWVILALPVLLSACPPEDEPGDGGTQATVDAAGAIDARPLGDRVIGDNPPDAGPQPDAAPLSQGQDPIENTLDFAVLPDDVVDESKVPVAGGPGSTPFSLTTEELFTLMHDETRIVKDLTGREIVLNIRWGYLFSTPAMWDWTDMSGFAAVSDGSIELVRPLRFEDAALGATRPHEDVVAPQTDPRLLTFSSTIGPGNDGLLVRIRRPVVRPVLLVVKVGDYQREYLFDHLFDSSTSVSNIDVGNHGLLVAGQHVPHGDLCYSIAGTLRGTFAVTSPPVPGALLATFTPKIGAPLDVVADTARSRLPYGAFAGTIGTTPFAGYWGRDATETGGPVLAAVGDDESELRGVITGSWRASSGTFSGTLSTRLPCTPGATRDFPLDNPASGGGGN